MRASATKATILALMAAALAPRPAAAATADEVDATIARAQAWLLSRPNFVRDGHWESAFASGWDAQQVGGPTALVTYALLASGISPNDPRLKKPIDFLRRCDMQGVYALGVRAQIWQYLPRSTENAAFVARDVRLLLGMIEQSSSKPDGGLFDYGKMERVRIDLSVSQYGTLGLWSGARLGAEVPPNVWKVIDGRWKGLQDSATGGWSYTGTGAPTGSMTAAGVATLFITLDHLAGPPRDEGNATEPAIDRGVDFLAAELPKILAGPGYSAQFYTLYGIERIGVAGGYKLLGNVDWYAAGCDFLVRTVNGEGYWPVSEWSAEVDTSFALLFLARGREPVMMNKIKYEQAAPATAGQPAEARWNQRGRDVANAARFVGQQLERSFNWQIIDLAAASVRDLHDAPIAYLSFRRGVPPTLTPDAIDKLREYVESGGMLLLNADWPPKDRGVNGQPVTQKAATTQKGATTPKGADAAPQKLFATLFPYATYRPLPADHPILRNQQFKATNWQRPPIVYELTNGVRTLGLYVVDDAGLAWQLNETTKQREKFELAADIYQYAIDKEHAQVKGRTHYVPPPAAQPTAEAPPISSRLRVARVRFNGNCDPEPGGWRRVQRLAAAEGIDVSVQPVDIEKADLADFRIAHLTGAGRIQLSPAAVERLKAFVDGGGVLLVDAAGGDPVFAADVERALAPISEAFRPTGKVIAADDPLYADAKRGPIPFRYRTFALASVGATSKPRIRGEKVGGRWGYLYSTEDLTAGLVGQPVDGIRGYTPTTATEVVMRLVRANAK